MEINIVKLYKIKLKKPKEKNNNEYWNYVSKILNNLKKVIYFNNIKKDFFAKYYLKLSKNFL